MMPNTKKNQPTRTNFSAHASRPNASNILEAYFATKVPIVWRCSSSDHDFEKATTRLTSAHNATNQLFVLRGVVSRAMRRFADRHSSRTWRSPRCERATREPPALSQHQRTALEAVVARMSRQHGCVGERREQ